MIYSFTPNLALHILQTRLISYLQGSLWFQFVLKKNIQRHENLLETVNQQKNSIFVIIN